MKRAGFSLVELVVVLAILMVLLAQAVPAYQQHVIRTRRQEAQSALLKLVMQQERFHTQNNTYISFSATSTEPEARHFQWWSGASPQRSAYELEGQPCDGELIAQCIQIVATPGTERVDSRFHDDDCGILKLTSSGLRAASGRMAGCWP